MQEEKEINLLDIVAFIVSYCKKNILKIILIFLLCIAIPVGHYLTKEQSYVSKASVTSNSIPFHLIAQIMNPIQGALKQRNFKLVGQLLKLPEEKVQSIQALSIEQIKHHPSYRAEGSSFTMEYRSVDPTIFSELETPTLNYINNNSFIEKIINVKIDGLKSYHNKLLEQMKRLDSIQKMIPNAITDFKQNKNALSDLNLGSIYQEMIDLKSKEKLVKEELDLSDEFKVLSGFIIVQNANKISTFIGIGIVFGLLVNLLVFIFYSIKRMARSKQQE